MYENYIYKNNKVIHRLIWNSAVRSGSNVNDPLCEIEYNQLKPIRLEQIRLKKCNTSVRTGLSRLCKLGMNELFSEKLRKGTI